MKHSIVERLMEVVRLSQITTLQATRSKQADTDPNGALAHKRNVGTLADIAQVIAVISSFLPHLCFHIGWKGRVEPWRGLWQHAQGTLTCDVGEQTPNAVIWKL